MSEAVADLNKVIEGLKAQLQIERGRVAALLAACETGAAMQRVGEYGVAELLETAAGLSFRFLITALTARGSPV